MSSCLLPHKWRKRREICWIFNEAESWGLWLHPYWWQGLIMNKSNISFPPQTQPYYRSLEKSKWSTVFFCEIIYGVRVDDCHTSSSSFYSLHRNYASAMFSRFSRFQFWNWSSLKWKSKIHFMYFLNISLLCRKMNRTKPQKTIKIKSQAWLHNEHF